MLSIIAVAGRELWSAEVWVQYLKALKLALRPRRPMVRSISCTRGLPGAFGVGGAFQRRGVTLRRDRSLQQDDLRGEEEEGARRRRREEEAVRRQIGRGEAASSATSTPSPAHKVNFAAKRCSHKIRLGRHCVS